jgi:cytochrome c
LDSRRLTALALAIFAVLLAGFTQSTSAAQTAADGKQLFEKRCGGCHSLDRDKEGPHLRGVYGRTAGTVSSFAYSDALRKSGIAWNDDTLEKWLTDTEKLAPGNDMAFRVENAAERRQIVAYLKQASSEQ